MLMLVQIQLLAAQRSSTSSVYYNIIVLSWYTQYSRENTELPLLNLKQDGFSWFTALIPIIIQVDDPQQN
ncbi:hypothetical protein XENTR_v10002464 [Xenopus tropicalis]|nr:hypothetical protein XENTR_v10002464 [Xenopus tropicalis]KAE8634909.1 hypothetical protein XENTR_v10002464 [Xenopus tropicalis]